MVSRTKELEEIFESFYALRQKAAFKKMTAASCPQIANSQWLALAVIARTDKATIKDVHTALGITSSAATQLVNELVSKKYVLRKTNIKDRRALALELSPTAKKFFKTMRVNAIKNLAQSFSALNDEEFALYIKLTRKILKR